jgi:hypothetical protein
MTSGGGNRIVNGIRPKDDIQRKNVVEHHLAGKLWTEL